ncbi:MAG: hypothetical protein HGB23_10580 [Chlorobiaceae bacterium]|nr:hypothetical protein [Chlorobiaceae bacterium]
MSDTINVYEDARFAPVLADLERISRDIVEKGKLFDLTGAKESAIVIAFETWGEGENAEPGILLKVTSPRDFDGSESLLDDFEDFVIGELEVASREWSLEVTELLGDERPIILLINGEEV